MRKLTIIAMAAAMAACSRTSPGKADLWADKKDTLEISMPDNPSTGYRWQMKGSRICDSIGFRYVQRAEPGDSGKAICGRGGTATYLISGRIAGIDTVRFELARFSGDSVVETRTYILGFR